MNQRRIGVLLSYIAILFSTIIGLLLTPFIIRMLGNSQYGVYILIGSFSLYLTIINSALSDTTIRYLVKFQANNDKESQKNLIGTMFYVNLFLAILVTIAGVSLWFSIPYFFSDSFNLIEISLARNLFIVVLISLIVSIVLNVFQGGIIAHQRFVFLKVIELISEIITAIMIVTILLYGYKALGIVIVTSSIQISIMVFKTIYYFKFIKLGITFKPEISKSLLKEIVIYAAPLVGIIVAEQIFWKLDNIIIGVISGAALITIYSIGMAFHKYFMRFSTVISKILMPKIMLAIDMGENPKEITDTLIKVSRVQALILMLVLSGLVSFGKEFIHLWVGEQYTIAYYIMLCTLIPYSLELIGNVRNIIMQAKDIYWKRMVVMLIVSVINILLTIVLLKKIGIVGAALATGLGILIIYSVITYILKKDVGIEVIRYFKELSKGIIPVVIIMLAIGSVLNIFDNISWATLFIKIFIFTTLYSLLIWMFGANEYEKNLIKSFLKKRNPVRSSQ